MRTYIHAYIPVKVIDVFQDRFKGKIEARYDFNVILAKLIVQVLKLLECGSGDGCMWGARAYYVRRNEVVVVLCVLEVGEVNDDVCVFDLKRVSPSSPSFRLT